MSAAPQSKEFRPDIEGLRALAILSVVLYHAGEWLPGGFTGVDVFFVISGFLITGIVLREHAATGAIDLARFWARRARRILPQATLVLVATAVASAFLLPPLLIEPVGEDILRASYFWLNWRAAGRAVDYSDPGNDLTPVLHYWSLGVEEQFYLVWPVVLVGLLWMAGRYKSRAAVVLGSILSAAIVASLAYSAAQMSANQPLAFFSTFSRVWQLMAGAAVAVAVSRGFACPATVARWLGPVGLVAILAGLAFLDASLGVPFPVALIAIAGTVAVIVAGTGSAATIASSILALPPFTAVGRLSYAWYLWHWPVFFFGWLLFPAHGVIMALAMAVLSLGLAALSHVAIEQPLRFHARLVKSSLLSLGLGVMLIGLGIAAARLLIAHGDGLSIRLSGGGTIPVEKIIKDRSTAYRIDCHASVQEVTHRPCRFGKEGAKAEVVLLGDSHAAQFFDPLAAAAENVGTGLLMRSKSGCPAILAGLWSAKFKRRYEECDDWRDGVLATIAAERPKLVILSSATAYEIIDPESGVATGKGQSIALYRDGLRRLIARILESAEKVVLIKDTPRFPEEPVNCLYRNPGNDRPAAGRWQV